ncbi:IclR family transcriptional regulator domain-containing protein [Aerococcus urinaeequi]|uniref:IclR family transcriptional regulator domain-containing protein n=1 Tax=Aerococcus urinaeequi TaxID=51665 RepID=UPI003D6A4159
MHDYQPHSTQAGTRESRRQGYSLTIEELPLGHYPLSFPVRNFENKVVCSLSIVGPLSRVNKVKT